MKQLPTNPDWFREQMENKRATFRAMARLFNKDASILHKIINGKIQAKSVDVANFANFFGVPVDDVMRALGETPLTGKKTLLVGTAGVDGPIRVYAKSKRTAVSRPDPVSANATAVTVAAPGSLFDGWLCYFVDSEKLAPEAIGRLGVTKDRKGKVWLGALKRGRRRGEWTVKTLDGSIVDVDAVSASGVLVVVP